MPDCGVHYLWFAFVCFLIRSPPPPRLCLTPSQTSAAPPHRALRSDSHSHSWPPFKFSLHLDPAEGRSALVCPCRVLRPRAARPHGPRGPHKGLGVRAERRVVQCTRRGAVLGMSGMHQKGRGLRGGPRGG